ncbi:MAG: methylenetetrahydrofolate reductase [Pseudomonadales bacterium]
MKTLQEKTAAGNFVITAEIVPAAAGGSRKLLEEAEPLRGLVDAINVTDGAGASTAMSSAAASAILSANGFDSVLQLTCRDRNRLALCADLLGAAAQNVRNMLVLTGDDPAKGDQPEAKPVFDLNSGEVMSIARAMRDDAALPNGKAVDEPPAFFIGCADVPIDPPSDWEPKALLAKIGFGAQFAQTQFCFDPAVAKRYMAALREAGITDQLKIILGIGPIASAKSARWMDENLYGVSVPPAIIERIEAAGDNAAQKQEGIAICRELLEEYRALDGVAGVHIMAPAASTKAIAAVLN